MSWGYWGIVIGISALVAMFFITMAIVYSHDTTAYGKAGQDDGQDSMPAKEIKTGSRAAA